ncbi:MAG: hypothetical protein LBL26_00880 [Peptococcaceae bacterium]|jgi:hypothetical protein|nr:hypothetical protein [Peptococcaceae bacterium]
MRYQAKESDILLTVRDFETICEYIDVNRPLLTQKEDLSTKACFELNERMAYPRSNAKRTDRMGRYATVRLYFQTAMSAGLLESYHMKAGKIAVALSENYEIFKQMNSYSKYLFIFLSWMLYANIAEFYEKDIFMPLLGVGIIDDVIAEIGQQTEFDWIQHDRNLFNLSLLNQPLQVLMRGCFNFLCHLRDFGLLAFDFEDLDDVRRMIITRFGAALSAACDSRKFRWVNKFEEDGIYGDYREEDDDEDEYDEEYYEEYDEGDEGDEGDEDYEDILEEEEEEHLAMVARVMSFRQNPPGSEGFFDPFLSCFPEGAIDAAALNRLLFPHSLP